MKSPKREQPSSRDLPNPAGKILETVTSAMETNLAPIPLVEDDMSSIAAAGGAVWASASFVSLEETKLLYSRVRG